MMNEHLDLDTEDIWVNEPLGGGTATSLHRNLQTLDASMRCEICRGLFRNPVSLNECQHTFCSECIRNSLTEQAKRVRQGGPTCPSCRAPLDGRRHESNYRPNRALARIVSNFANVREPLHQALVEKQNDGVDGVASRAATTTTTAAAARTRRQEHSDDFTMESRRGTKRAASPCLETLEPKKRVIYNYKKKKELQDLCRKEGISSVGTEDQLKDRHARFIVFWNSHTDNLDGCSKTKRQIIDEFNKMEQEKNKLANKDRYIGAAVDQVVKKAQAGESLGNSQFEKTLKSNFSQMIAQLRSKAKKKDSNEITKPKEENNGEVEIEESSSMWMESDPEETAPSLKRSTPVKQEEFVKIDTSSPELTNESVHPKAKQEPPVQKEKEMKPANQASDNNESERIVQDCEEDIPLSPGGFYRKYLMRHSLTGAWTCSRCTFFNETRTWSTAVCEICGARRPKPSASRR